MPKPLPVELRRRVVDAYRDGEGTFEEIAQGFRVAVSSALRWVQFDRYTNDVSPKPHAGGWPPKIPSK